MTEKTLVIQKSAKRPTFKIVPIQYGTQLILYFYAFSKFFCTIINFLCENIAQKSLLEMTCSYANAFCTILMLGPKKKLIKLLYPKVQI